MSKPVIITADSTCDLSQDLLERFSIKTIPLTILLGEESFYDGFDFTPADMYVRYRADGTLPKTSAPSVQQFIDFFRPFVEAGCEIVHLDIGSELSSSYSTACIAASELGGVYPVDSRMLSTGVGLLVIEAAECRDRGMKAAEIAEHVASLTDKVDTSFVLDTLEFMWKGGRCSGVAALGANLLHLKPALEMSAAAASRPSTSSTSPSALPANPCVPVTFSSRTPARWTIRRLPSLKRWYAPRSPSRRSTTRWRDVPSHPTAARSAWASCSSTSRR